MYAHSYIYTREPISDQSCKITADNTYRAIACDFNLYLLQKSVHFSTLIQKCFEIRLYKFNCLPYPRVSTISKNCSVIHFIRVSSSSRSGKYYFVNKKSRSDNSMLRGAVLYCCRAAIIERSFELSIRNESYRCVSLIKSQIAIRQNLTSNPLLYTHRLYFFFLTRISPDQTKHLQ